MRRTVMDDDLVLVSVDGLAQILHKRVTSIRSDAVRNPQALPPRCELPGTRRLLWRRRDIAAWLAAHVAPSVTTDRTSDVRTVRSQRGPGRPRNALRRTEAAQRS